MNDLDGSADSSDESDEDDLDESLDQDGELEPGSIHLDATPDLLDEDADLLDDDESPAPATGNADTINEFRRLVKKPDDMP